MRMFHRTAPLAAALVMTFVGGCYWDRLTWQYNEAEELNGQAQAVIEQSSTAPDAQKKRLQLLEKLEHEANQPYNINAGDSLSIVVYNHEDLSTRTIVTPDGYIGMVLAGQIKVSWYVCRLGLTKSPTT